MQELSDITVQDIIFLGLPVSAENLILLGLLLSVQKLEVLQNITAPFIIKFFLFNTNVWASLAKYT
jgi:hypothetical protein